MFDDCSNINKIKNYFYEIQNSTKIKYLLSLNTCYRSLIVLKCTGNIFGYFNVVATNKRIVLEN